MKKKILIIYAPYGSGHKSIANYVAGHLENKGEFEIEVLDIAKYANFLGRASIKGFDMVIKYRTNHLFSFIYDLADNKIASLSQIKMFKKAFDNKELKEEIVKFNPHLTIATHFAGSNIISYYNKLGLTNSKLLTVITDYATHAYWYKDHAYQDGYVVANEMIKNHMIKKGVDSKKLLVYGLPLDKSRIKIATSKEELFFKYSLNPLNKTYLFFGGGTHGSTANFDYLKTLIKLKLPINIIFVSGKNSKLENKARGYVVKHNVKNVKVLGFVTDVNSLYNISDVCITKPGGATITECIHMQVPMILIPGNGGPEKYNARYVCKKKYGLKCFNVVGLCKAVKKTYSNEQLLNRFKSNLAKEKENNSCEKIYEYCNKLLKD